MEEICRHQARGDPRQGPARRQSAEEHQGIYRAHRHPGRVGADPRTAAASEGGDRARFRQTELRRRSPELSRAEAAVRKGRLARRHVRLPEGPEPHGAGPRRKRLLRRRAAIRQKRQGPDAVAAVVGRLLHPLLQQGAVPEEGRRGAEDVRRDGRGRGKAHGRQGRHLRLRRARLAQRQHDAVDQLLPQLRRRVPRQQGQHPDRRPRSHRGDQALSDPADKGRPARRRRLQLDGVDGFLHARTLGDVDRRRRLGTAAGRPFGFPRRRQGRLHHRPRRAQGTIFGDLRRRPRHRRCQQEQGSGLPALPMGGVEGAGRAAAAGRRRRAVPQFHPQRSRDPEGREDAEGMAAVGDRFRQDQQARPARCHPGCRIPRSRRRGASPPRSRAPIPRQN